MHPCNFKNTNSTTRFGFCKDFIIAISTNFLLGYICLDNSFLILTFFFLSRFSFTDTDDSQGKGGDRLFFHSTTSTRSRTFRHLFATLHVRWLSHIFNRTACIYQTATRWDLPPSRITIWLIDNVRLIFVCLLDDLILGFCYSNFGMGSQWSRTRTVV